MAVPKRRRTGFRYTNRAFVGRIWHSSVRIGFMGVRGAAYRSRFKLGPVESKLRGALLGGIKWQKLALDRRPKPVQAPKPEDKRPAIIVSKQSRGSLQYRTSVFRFIGAYATQTRFAAYRPLDRLGTHRVALNRPLSLPLQFGTLLNYTVPPLYAAPHTPILICHPIELAAFYRFYTEYALSNLVAGRYEWRGQRSLAFTKWKLLPAHLPILFFPGHIRHWWLNTRPILPLAIKYPVLTQ